MTGALPAGLSAGTTHYIKNPENYVKPGEPNACPCPICQWSRDIEAAFKQRYGMDVFDEPQPTISVDPGNEGGKAIVIKPGRAKEFVEKFFPKRWDVITKSQLVERMEAAMQPKKPKPKPKPKVEHLLLDKKNFDLAVADWLVTRYGSIGMASGMMIDDLWATLKKECCSGNVILLVEGPLDAKVIKEMETIATFKVPLDKPPVKVQRVLNKQKFMDLIRDWETDPSLDDDENFWKAVATFSIIDG